MLSKFSIRSIRATVVPAIILVVAVLGYSNYDLSRSSNQWKTQVRDTAANLGNSAIRAAQGVEKGSDIERVISAEYRTLENNLDANSPTYPSGLPSWAVFLLIATGCAAGLGLLYIGRKEQELVEANDILNRRLVEISTSISKHLPGGSINASELGRDLPDEAMQLLVSFEDYAKKQAETNDQLKRSFNESEVSRKSMKQELEGTTENLEICKNMVRDCVAVIANSTKSITTSTDDTCYKLSSKIDDLSSLKTHADKIIETYKDVMKRFDKSSKLNSKSVEHALLAQEKIESLKDAATRMGSVVDVITRIAEHTNHLALNATIEAARAGEAGKGFNVVATEVKDLSTQTSDEMKKISAQIVAIQNATGQSVAAIEDVVQTTKEVSDLAMESSENPVDEVSIRTIKDITSNILGHQDIDDHRKLILESAGKIDAAMENASNYTQDE